MSESEDVLKNVLTGFMENIKKDMRGRGQYVSGDTERLFEVKVSTRGTHIIGELLGPTYIQSLITGRGPTRSGGGGGQTLQQKLFDWIKRKGIQPDESGMTQESLSWAIAKHMHEHGNKLFQQGGDTGLLVNNIDQKEADKAVLSIGENEFKRVSTEFIKEFKT